MIRDGLNIVEFLDHFCRGQEVWERPTTTGWTKKTSCWGIRTWRKCLVLVEYVFIIYIYICLYMYIYSWLCPFIYSKIPCGHGSRMVYRGGTKETNGVDGATFWVCRVRGWLVNPCSKWRTGSSSGNHGHLFLEGNGCLLRLIFQGWLQGWLLLHAQQDSLDVVQKNVGKHPRSYWVAMFFQDLIIWLIDVCDLNYDQIKFYYVLFEEVPATLLQVLAKRCWGFPFWNLGPLAPPTGSPVRLVQGPEVWHWLESVTWSRRVQGSQGLTGVDDFYVCMILWYHKINQKHIKQHDVFMLGVDWWDVFNEHILHIYIYID